MWQVNKKIVAGLAVWCGLLQSCKTTPENETNQIKSHNPSMSEAEAQCTARANTLSGNFSEEADSLYAMLGTPYVNEQFDPSLEVQRFKRHYREVYRSACILAADAGVRGDLRALVTDQTRGRKRVFHAKSHGCYNAKLYVNPHSIPEPHRKGIFADNSHLTYNALVRFSNGLGENFHDAVPDVRGLAVKVAWGEDPATGKKVALDGERFDPSKHVVKTFDWTATNAPNPFAKDQEEFIEFARAFNPFTVGGLKTYISTPRKRELLTHRIIPTTARVLWMKSVIEEPYWSGHPYLLGSNMAMKYSFIPAGKYMSPVEAEAYYIAAERLFDNIQDLKQQFPNVFNAETVEHIRKIKNIINAGDVADAFANLLKAQSLAKLQSDYHRRELQSRDPRRAGRFNFYIQLDQNNPNLTPIEDSSIPWKAPYIKAGSLDVLNRVADSDCDDLSFTPGHFHPAHRPAGSMGRGRIYTYSISAKYRNAHADQQGLTPAKAKILFQNR